MINMEPKKSLVDIMRENREESSVALHEFMQCRELFSNHIFCFFEGEDVKYYLQRINDYTENEVEPIIAGNKEKVLRVMKLIKCRPEYNNVQKMFFVDRDMDDDSLYENDDLFITPCYSIENLYVNDAAFSAILKTEFSLKSVDNDYVKYMQLFKDLYKSFCDIMLEFNALVLLRSEKKLNNGKVCISNIKTNQLVCLDILSGVTISHHYNTQIDRLKSDLDVTDSEINEAKIRLLSMGEPCNVFRGKNQLDFMVEFINQLRNRKEETGVWEVKRKCISISISNNRLSELSQYANTPDTLIMFIQNHKISKKLLTL